MEKNSGYDAQTGSSGDDAKIGNSGNCAKITATGENAVVACAGNIKQIVLGNGGCIAAPWNDGIRIRFAVACVGENGIQAGTPYYVNNNGEFIKISSNT